MYVIYMLLSWMNSCPALNQMLPSDIKQRLTWIRQFAPLTEIAVKPVEYVADSKLCNHTGSFCCLENLRRVTARTRSSQHILHIHKYVKQTLARAREWWIVSTVDLFFRSVHVAHLLHKETAQAAERNQPWWGDPAPETDTWLLSPSYTQPCMCPARREKCNMIPSWHYMYTHKSLVRGMPRLSCVIPRGVRRYYYE